MNFLILSLLGLMVLTLALIEWFIPYFRKSMISWFSTVFVYIFPELDVEKNDEFIRLKESLAKVAVNVTYSIIIIFLISLYFSVIYPTDENKLTGPLGDLFNGLLAPILSFLTFCGLLVTIFIQQHQLKMTLREFELNRDEIAKSTDALEGQMRNSSAQKFDGNFYSLLQKQENITMGFLNIKGDFKWYSTTVKCIFNKESHESEWRIEKDKYLKFFLINYQILDYISYAENKKIIDSEEARRYRNIVRAMTPNEFLELLLINCQGGDHKTYKKYLIEAKYFEHYCLEKSDAYFYAKLFKSWPLKSFGDKKRIIEYFNKESYYVRDYLVDSLVDEKSLKNILESMRHNGLITNQESNKIVSKKNDFKTTLENKLKVLKTEEIGDNEELFEAFIECDALYFLEYLDVDSSFVEEYNQYLIYKNIV